MRESNEATLARIRVAVTHFGLGKTSLLHFAAEIIAVSRTDECDSEPYWWSAHELASARLYQVMGKEERDGK